MRIRLGSLVATGREGEKAVIYLKWGTERRHRIRRPLDRTPSSTAISGMLDVAMLSQPLATVIGLRAEAGLLCRLPLLATHKTQLAARSPARASAHSLS